MKRSLVRAAAALLVALCGVAAAHADTLIDFDPAGAGGIYAGGYANRPDYSFLVKLNAAEGAVITGFGIYTMPQYPGFTTGLGTSVVLKIRADESGTPDPDSNLFTMNSVITSVEEFGSYRLLFAQFSSVTLSAGDYWLGMSSASLNGSDDIGWNGYYTGTAINPPYQARLFYGQLVSPGFIYDLGYRVTGEGELNRYTGPQGPGPFEEHPGGVPEPGVWALFITGFGLAGGAIRRRRRPLALG